MDDRIDINLDAEQLSTGFRNRVAAGTANKIYQAALDWISQTRLETRVEEYS